MEADLPVLCSSAERPRFSTDRTPPAQGFSLRGLTGTVADGGPDSGA